MRSSTKRHTSRVLSNPLSQLSVLLSASPSTGPRHTAGPTAVVGDDGVRAGARAAATWTACGVRKPVSARASTISTTAIQRRQAQVGKLGEVHQVFLQRTQVIGTHRAVKISASVTAMMMPFGRPDQPASTAPVKDT